ncbi:MULTISPECIES: LysM peptidoglycan-binding domain-containing protein [Ornithinimicrobium]|jgi:hypothetical protein|uniref:LysM peptidoglycan-binding domain-containing protein n=1 Tax=Ornithinimicrobium kibberense TaxID=282060 RepID=A0ABV5UZI4_9MICO|nr:MULTISPECIES: LysM peptidoglycan-binding domain-containing protein [Ornithinimicrobium]OLT22154.1 hypothetical protein BJF81_13615 [Ornithinimicrobium sp. CNJ-824]
MSTATADLHPVSGAVAPWAVSRPGGHLRLVAADERRPVPAPVRLTRRGRLTLTATAVLVLVLAFASLFNAIGPAGASSAVTVEPGTTLSQIAAEHLPDVPLSQAVVDIQRANKLSTTSVAAGQVLVIPGR